MIKRPTYKGEEYLVRIEGGRLIEVIKSIDGCGVSQKGTEAWDHFEKKYCSRKRIKLSPAQSEIVRKMQDGNLLLELCRGHSPRAYVGTRRASGRINMNTAFSVIDNCCVQVKKGKPGEGAKYKLRTDLEFVFTERDNQDLGFIYKVTNDGVIKFKVLGIGPQEARLDRVSSVFGGSIGGFESRCPSVAVKTGAINPWYVVYEDAIQQLIKNYEYGIEKCYSKIHSYEKKVEAARKHLSAQTSGWPEKPTPSP